jgi:hypothetical protein
MPDVSEGLQNTRDSDAACQTVPFMRFNDQKSIKLKSKSEFGGNFQSFFDFPQEN